MNHPNRALTNHLNRLNFHRIADLITTSDRYEGMKFAIAAAFLGCPDLPSFLPEPYRSFHGESPNLAAIGEDTLIPLGDGRVDSQPLFDRLKYLLSTDVRTWNWGIADDTVFGEQQDDNRFVDDSIGLEAVMSCRIGPQLLAQRPELDHFRGEILYAGNLSIPKDQFCAQLKAASRVAIAAQPWGKLPIPRNPIEAAVTWTGECEVARDNGRSSATATIRHLPARHGLRGTAVLYAFDQDGNPLGTAQSEFNVTSSDGRDFLVMKSTQWSAARDCYVNFRNVMETTNGGK